MAAWSYSSIKTFDQCPKKYYHLKVARDVKDAQTAAILYGNEVHKAAELNVKNDTPVPEKFGFITRFIDALKKLDGEKHCELKLGVRRAGENLEPCGFFDRDVWYRGIVDLLIENGETGYIIDYKTGRNTRYADTKQLDLMAAATFVHYPKLKELKSALAFVVTNDLIKKIHKREDMLSYMGVFSDELERLAVAHESGVWNPVSGPLCKFCPVTSCEFNKS